VRAWLPRWRPWGESAPARLYASQTCGPCSRFGRWVAHRRPVALERVPAEHYPRPLRRMTYETDDSAVRAEGVAALGRMLSHLHLGWAVVGWLLAVPGVRWFAQLCAHAFGAGPRDIPHQGQANPRAQQGVSGWESRRGTPRETRSCASPAAAGREVAGRSSPRNAAFWR
jgi:hypothetical protein